jgi:hypothetical protein
MPGFYSEVSYHPGANLIERIEPLTDAKELEKYLFLIDLKDLTTKKGPD